MYKKTLTFWMLSLWSIALLLVQAPALGTESDEDAIGFKCVGSIGGEIRDYFHFGDHVFFFQGGFTLRALNIKDPAHPRLGGFLRMNKDPEFAIFNPPALYTQAFMQGFSVVDLSGPNPPRLLKTFPNDGGNMSIQRMGSFLYLSDSGKYGHWYDLYDIRKPLEPKDVAAGDPRYSVRGGFVTDGKRLFIIKEGKSEKKQGKSDQNETYKFLVLDWNTSRTLGSLTSEDYENPYEFRVDSRGVLSISATDSTSSLMLMSNVHGEKIWSNIQASESENNEGVMSLWSDQKGKSIRPTNSADAKIWDALDQYRSSGQYIEGASDFKIYGGLGYLTDKQGDLVIVDLKDTARPNVIGRMRGLSLSKVYAVEDEMVYAGGNSLFAIDCTRPSTPTLAGRYTGPLGPMVANGTRLYAASGENGLQILDTTKRDAITRIGEYSILKAEATSVAVSGTRVYLAVDYEHTQDLMILDVADPARPRLLSRTPVFADEEDEDIPAEGGTQIKKLGNIAYLIRIVSSSGICESRCEIVDVTDADAPQILGAFSTDDDTDKEDKGNSALNQQGKPKRWYLGLPSAYRNTFTHASMMFFYDLSSPTKPTYVGKYYELYGDDAPVLYQDPIAVGDGTGLVLLRPAD